MQLRFNWKVLAGLGVLALGVYTVAPGLIVGALPFLPALICPIAMVLMGCTMMGGMGKQSSAIGAGTAADGGTAWYTCSMHPEVQRSEPGQCPSCGMSLVRASGTNKSIPAGTSPALNGSREQQIRDLLAQSQEVQERQVSIARQIADLQDTDRSTVPALPKAMEERVG